MKKTTFAATLLSTANLALAAPVYLDCVTKFDSPRPSAAREFRFSVKIDEASGNITHTDSDGSAFNATGFFTAGEVAYKVDGASDTFINTTSYTINRTNLSVTRTFSAELSERGKDALQKWDDTPSSIVTRGTCKTVDAKNRKF